MASVQIVEETDPLITDNDRQSESATEEKSYGGSSSSSRDSEVPETSHLGERDGGTSNFSTIMHIIKGNVGTGVLAMPSAFANAGILVGTVGLLLLGIICVHCMHLLVKCSHYLCKKAKKSHLDYADVAEQAFKYGPAPLQKHSNKARNTVNVFLLITQFGFCCVYVLFVSQNIQKIINKIADIRDEDAVKVQVYEVVVVLLLIPFVFIRDIKYLAPFSLVANIASFVGLGVILYYILIHQELQPIERLPLFAGWAQLPLYFGTAIYAFEGIGVVLPMENKMKEPQAFPSFFGVLNLGMTIVCALYMTVGFYGYIEFGSDSLASITLNLESWYGIAVQAIFCFCIFVSYGLQFYVPMEIMARGLEELKGRTSITRRISSRLFNYLVRTFFVLLTFAVAAAVDSYLDLLISLIGSVASSGLALIFPAILDIITFWPDRQVTGSYWLSFSKDIVLIVIGLLGFVFGTEAALHNLIQSLSH